MRVPRDASSEHDRRRGVGKSCVTLSGQEISLFLSSLLSFFLIDAKQAHNAYPLASDTERSTATINDDVDDNDEKLRSDTTE